MMHNINTAYSSPALIHKVESPEMLGESFEKWRKYIYDSCGIYFQDNKKYLLESRLLKRMEFHGLNSYDEYLKYLLYDLNGRNEQKYLFDAITINETFFFRNQPQLDALVGTILPEIIKNKSSVGNRKIKIWSAASSSGEEAYSIAISISDLIAQKYPGIDYEITGTDISESVIKTARSGVYKTYSMRNTAPYYLKKYFKVTASGYEIAPEIKNKVNFRLLNLYDDLEMKKMFNYDVIFCANVLIYFDLKSKIKVVNRLYNSLNRDGYLFIGYSETLHNISRAFKIVSFPKTIGYKKE